MGRQSKKLSLFNTLEILKKYTDENHRLTQAELLDLLKQDYDMEIDRRTIKSNLMDLIELGYEIESQETTRMIRNEKTGEVEESTIMSSFYLVRDFSKPELRLLIDSLLFSKHLPYSQCKELVTKLESLSNKYFRSNMSYISTMPEDKTNNKQIFYNIDVLDEAISKGRKVSFKYLEYGTDKEQHVKLNQEGDERVYVVSPYQMVAKEGKYYLICNYDAYDDISNYRVDRIAKIQILDAKAKPFENLKWSKGQRLNLAEYMKNHVYMYASDDSTVCFRIIKSMISDVIDMFGKDVQFYDETEDSVCVRVNVNESAMIQFAQSYAPDVEILEPLSLREEVKKKLREGYRVYE
ncbi:Predicted DNA-binding transcriptional regulator YafY, contains an HTH and WYL domains [Pseudobutyrivibrio sp. C4]|nr:Predicted DNA-binding transcriptional regulator YafY, contains an HTH and WYL domains [Pseudobutyrivibrio sp. C4]